MKRLHSIIVLSIIVLSFSGCDTKEQETTTKLQLTTSLYPIYEAAKEVAGERADVFKILPDGVGAHDYKPTPKDVVKLTNSDAVFYLGDEFEPWMSNLIKNHKNKISVTQNLELLKRELHEDVDPEEEHRHHHHEHDHANMIHDPHVWLDIQNYMQIVRDITDELIKLDPQHKDYYFLNATLFISKLKILDDDYQKGLEGCKKDTIIVTHNAYNYLSQKYGFEVIAIGSVIDEDEPTAKKLTKIMEFAKSKNIDTIFLDMLSSNNFSTMVANELGAKKLYLHPLGNINGTREAKEQNYLSIMRKNLEAIAIALQCQ